MFTGRAFHSWLLWAVIDANGVETEGQVQRPKNQNLWQIQAGYAFGNNQIKAMYGSVNRDDSKVFTRSRETLSINSFKGDLEGDRYTWAIGFDHNFSKRSKVYALYTAVDDDLKGVPGEYGAEWSGFSVGMIHKF